MARSPPRPRTLLIVFFLLAFSLFPGCIEMGNEVDEIHRVQTSVPSEPLSPAPVFAPSGPVVTPSPTQVIGTVVDAEPIPPSVAVTLSYREMSPDGGNLARPNEMPTATFKSSVYNLRYTDIGLLATVEQAPFVIEFWTSAYNQNPYDSLVVITVRDPCTGEIILEDGYNGLYSSDPYKRMVIRKSGQFHVNIYGMRSGIEVKFRGGVDESAAEPYGKWGVPRPVVREVMSEEEYLRMMEEM